VDPRQRYRLSLIGLAGVVATAVTAAVTERWLANMRRRIQLEYLRGARLERGDLAADRSLQARIDRMKARGNVTGQRFGLRICTSNGPGRALVPHY
jgi:hypothetical protein